MKAVAVFPGKKYGIHLTDLAEPSVGDVPGGRGVLVEVPRVGVDGTDEEINDAEYGAARLRLPGHRPRVVRPGGAGDRTPKPSAGSSIRPGGRTSVPLRTA